ncbi:MAG: hexokinase [Prevotellaceae bacterium]|jgi:hexokinase|nr:hexokinase [Prevotellaceae bacterium]
MENNIFELNPEAMKNIANVLRKKIGEGLREDGREIRCLPTYINPKTGISTGKTLVLDLGGTNFRATIVEFADGKAKVHEGIKKNLATVMKAAAGNPPEALYAEISELIASLDLGGVESIGYCFSYPCESMLDGDAVLLHWTKGVTLKGMVGQPVGQPLMQYLNEHVEKAKFTTIKVINDTVASLFAGLTDSSSQAHIGLIVGTGTNMATFFAAGQIPKLHKGYTQQGLVPVNLESGNFYPPHLTVVDDKIDKYSDSPGAQRFEKAMSGMYLGRLLEFLFASDEFEANFDAEKLTRIMSYPDMYKKKYVRAAWWVYERSSKLVAASLAGLILALTAAADTPIRDIRLTAEGSLFWSEDQKGNKNVRFTSYKNAVVDELSSLLRELGHPEIKVHVERTEHANLIGSAIAALS